MYRGRCTPLQSVIWAKMRQIRMNILQSLRSWAKRIKADAMTLWFACRNPRTPWHAKALGMFVVAYALSPIDLIPDFIPILGYLDDVLLLPILMWLTLRLLPADVLQECRVQAEEWIKTAADKPRSMSGAALVLVVWLAVALGIAWWLYG